ncbi:elongation factor P hydroxylase [Haliea sp. E1-2-M8]|uniref:elongation factor P hydroxylase n=1 Tax=Haliea sp. E1-2-M8 TaxID=3064706 RepID=UPI002725C546|nr:elongation factor P hydroxylase [Haliea sp. E1-2-M8]MDO8863896.1 elongation factor P hydroxylase [Haliea sp. E1-2-M8]
MISLANAAISDPFCSGRLQRVFDACFAGSENTLLCGGAGEPLYAPATNPGDPHRLWYREDFFASALHEVAHWCIAGPARRLLPDFGYWYAPEGRNADQQAAFESVEVAPQALEWCFAIACGYRFQVSTDNLAAERGTPADHSAFKAAVCREARRRARQGLPPRARQFHAALQAEFGLATRLTPELFTPDALT